MCIAGSLVLLTFAAATRAQPMRRRWVSLVLVTVGVCGTVAVLAAPALRNARVGMVWCFVLLVLLSTTFYLQLIGRIPSRRVAMLLTLRVLALAALVPMLFEPVLRYTRIPPPERPVVIVVDASGSMSIPDRPNGPTRLQTVWQALEPQLGRLRQHFVPQFHVFAADARLLDRPEDLASLAATGTSTDIVAGVRQSLPATARDAAVVILISDGVDNVRSDAPEAIAELRRRVYTVAVGSETTDSAAANIAVADIRTDDDLAVGHEAAVSVTVRSTALANRVVDVNLAEVDADGKPVGPLSQARLVLQPTARGQQVSLKFTPARAGLQRLAAWIDPAAGERSTADNRQQFQAFAVDPAIRVLYIEGRLRPEFRDLRRLLESDPNIETAILLRIQTNRFVANGSVNRQKISARLPTGDEWTAFDVIILGDLDASFLSPQHQAAIEQAVAGGKSLLMIGGEKSFGPGGYGGTAIERTLPVVVGPTDSPQEIARFVPRLTADGAAHPAMEGLRAFFGVESASPTAQLPPLNGNVVVAGEKGGAQVLMTHPGKPGPDGKAMIALATHRYGQGRAAALTVHSTYLWALPMHGLGQDSPYNRLWGQLIRWLAGADVRSRQRGGGVNAMLNRSVYQSGESVRLRAQVRDDHGDATGYAQVSAKVRPTHTGERAGGTSFPLNPVEGRPGQYEVSVPSLVRGDYIAAITATKDGKDLGQSDVKFTVVPPADEMLKLAADRELLRRIAIETRAGSYDIGRFPELVDELIRGDPSARPEQLVVRIANFAHVATVVAGRPADWPRKYDLPMQAAIVVPLLAIEWVLRRRWQLA